MEDEALYIYGKHAVIEASQDPRRLLTRVFIAPSRKDEALLQALTERKVTVSLLEPGKLPKGVDPESVHQGVIGVISRNRLMYEYKDFIEQVSITPDTCVVILGEIQDPHNVGAIIRSAAAFGVSAVLIPVHNQAQVTGAVIKVSAGMAFQIPLVSVGNVNTALRDLKERGFWTYGLDGGAAQSVGSEVYDRPTAFVLGSEGKGIREKTLAACDVVVSIPMHPRCESLNVSVSAAIALQSWSSQHPKALR